MRWDEMRWDIRFSFDKRAVCSVCVAEQELLDLKYPTTDRAKSSVQRMVTNQEISTIMHCAVEKHMEVVER